MVRLPVQVQEVSENVADWNEEIEGDALRSGRDRAQQGASSRSSHQFGSRPVIRVFPLNLRSANARRDAHHNLPGQPK
jgi:hypothetical protein